VDLSRQKIVLQKRDQNNTTRKDRGAGRRGKKKNKEAGSSLRESGEGEGVVVVPGWQRQHRRRISDRTTEEGLLREIQTEAAIKRETLPILEESQKNWGKDNRIALDSISFRGKKTFSKGRTPTEGRKKRDEKEVPYLRSRGKQLCYRIRKHVMGCTITE